MQTAQSADATRWLTTGCQHSENYHQIKIGNKTILFLFYIFARQFLLKYYFALSRQINPVMSSSSHHGETGTCRNSGAIKFALALAPVALFAQSANAMPVHMTGWRTHNSADWPLRTLPAEPDRM
jgi:hypothetical protein